MIVIDGVDEDEMTLRQMRCYGDNDDIRTGEIRIRAIGHYRKYLR